MIIFYSLPRSQTQWLSKVLNLEHEGFSHAITNGTYQEYLRNLPKRIIDGNLIWYKDFIDSFYFNPTQIVIRRSIKSVINSLTENNLPFKLDHLEKLDKALDESGLPSIEYPLTASKLSNTLGVDITDKYDSINIDSYRRV